MRISDFYNIDLVESHINARKDEEESLLIMGVNLKLENKN